MRHIGFQHTQQLPFSPAQAQQLRLRGKHCPRNTRQRKVLCQAQPELWGVPISPYSASQALNAVTGKSFACTLCGKCCSFAGDAEVWVSSKEIRQMSTHLGVSIATFTAVYCQPYEQVPGWRLLQSKTVPVASAPAAAAQQIADVPSGPQVPQYVHGPPHQARVSRPRPKGFQVPPYQQQAWQQQKAGMEQQQTQVCIFLNEETNGCGIYGARPTQCSTYPWWPELMPERNWKAEKVYMCEGLEHPDAESTDVWHAAQQLQQATDHTLALEAAKPPDWDAEQLYS